jgi:hypothetical protein
VQIFKSDPRSQYYGVRFTLRSGRQAERFFETPEDLTFFLEENDYEGLAFTRPLVVDLDELVNAY